VKTELGSLATGLCVKTDDLLKGSPQCGPWRPAVGIAPQLSDAELETPLMQAMLGFTSEARRLRHARAHLRYLFPYLPKQPGYSKRLRKSADLVRHVTRTLARDTTLWSDDVWGVDSRPVECGRSRETVKPPTWPDGCWSGRQAMPGGRGDVSGGVRGGAVVALQAAASVRSGTGAVRLFRRCAIPGPLLGLRAFRLGLPSARRVMAAVTLAGLDRRGLR
jgi:hypothetical protein